MLIGPAKSAILCLLFCGWFLPALMIAVFTSMSTAIFLGICVGKIWCSNDTLLIYNVNNIFCIYKIIFNNYVTNKIYCHFTERIAADSGQV